MTRSGTGAPPMPASIEVTPAQAAMSEALPDLLPRGIRVYLTDTGTGDWETTQAGACRLTDLGYVAVAHVAARRCPSRAALEARIGGLSQEAGVRDLLIIGGDSDRPAGPFAAALDVLEAGVVDRFGITDVGLAGHPEGSPAVSAAALADAMRRKRAAVTLTDARVQLVTQFGFDAGRLVAWSDISAATSPDVPIHLGIAGPARMATLIKYAAACGVGNSLLFLKKRAGSVSKLAAGFDPEDMAAEIESHVAGHAPSPIRQFHVFAFGGIERTAEWLTARGSWRGTGV